MSDVRIGKREVGRERKPYLVAEIGQNHNGDPYLATRLISDAVKAGCDAVKFVKMTPRKNFTPQAYNATYDSEHSYGSTYGEHREALELSIEELVGLEERIAYNEWPIDTIMTVCDLWAIDDVMDNLKPKALKIASRDLTNLPLVRAVSQTGLPVILSTGMIHAFGEVHQALQAVLEHTRDVIVLKCHSSYPTNIQDVGLEYIPAMLEMSNGPVGLSYHGNDPEVCVGAVALGASMIEVHVTKSRAMKGRDHGFSWVKEELEELRESIDLVHTASMYRYNHPAATAHKLGRSICAAQDLKEGHLIDQDDLELRSPGTGLSWSERTQVIGKTVRDEIREGEMVTDAQVRDLVQYTTKSNFRNDINEESEASP